MRPAATARPFGLLAGLVILSLATSACDAPRRVRVPLGSQLLAGLYWEPPQPLAPAVLLLQTPEPNAEHWTPFARRLRQEGYAVLILDLADGAGNNREFLLAGAGAGFNFLREQKKVDAARIGLIGAASGAEAALDFAAREPLARLVVLLSPGARSQSSASELTLRDYGFRPLLLMAGEEDHLSGATVRRLAGDAQGEAVVKLYPGAAQGAALLAWGSPLTQDVLIFLKGRL